MKISIPKKSKYIQAVEILAEGARKLYGPKCKTKSLFCPCCLVYRILDLVLELARDMDDVEGLWGLQLKKGSGKAGPKKDTYV